MQLSVYKEVRSGYHYYYQFIGVFVQRDFFYSIQSLKDIFKNHKKCIHRSNNFFF